MVASTVRVIFFPAEWCCFPFIMFSTSRSHLRLIDATTVFFFVTCGEIKLWDCENFLCVFCRCHCVWKGEGENTETKDDFGARARLLFVDVARIFLSRSFFFFFFSAFNLFGRV